MIVAPRVICFLLSAVTLAVTPGCGPPATEARFDSANPSAKIYAIQRAEKDHDLSKLCNIIDQLDSDDPAVRLVAIGALRKLTGQTHGYEYSDSRPVRRAAIDDWVKSCGCDGVAATAISSVPRNPTQPPAGGSLQ
ncbi:MAG TPA: hypothetical protein VG711_04695 [Phycisphaerales bacterium]|nr:hypothetical protein [Phycisphaerales bacterium]